MIFIIYKQVLDNFIAKHVLTFLNQFVQTYGLAKFALL